MLLYGGGLLLAFALAPVVFPNPYFRIVIGDTVPLLVLLAAFIVSTCNAMDSHGHARLFWGLIAAAMAMWSFNQGCWVWFEVVLRQPLPEPSPGAVMRFLHIIPIMAAVALRPHQADEREGMVASTLNVLILLMWGIVAYAFFVFPEAYIVRDVAAYGLRRDLLYTLGQIILIALSASAFFSSSGAWRRIYGDIFLAAVVYTFSLEALRAAVARGVYETGGVYDLGFLAAALAFLWVPLAGRERLRDSQQAVAKVVPRRPIAPRLAMLALLSLPLMGYWAIFWSHDPPYLRHVRFTVVLGGVAILAALVFLQQHLMDRKLLQLLRHSRTSFDNLQRLQGRVVQQAKLASLGELVALAASELEFPLSMILRNSEHIAASSNLSREQLGIAQKIGQQARRTRELVSDLLSFAQQTPGEKGPLELKPLLQRAVQMEGFKLETKKIVLTVESSDPLPRVFGNANQLLQAFLQIVENAVDALQEIGGGSLQISLWCEEDEVMVQFSDSGPGLRDPERVFDPFYTTKPVGKGTGLGLSATYGVIKDHQGQITCYNRPEGGAAFEIRLPAFKMSAPIADAARA